MRIVTEKEQEKFRDYIDDELKNVQRKHMRRLAGEENGYTGLNQLNHDLIQLVNILKYSVMQTQAQKIDYTAESHHLDRLAALKRYKETVDGTGSEDDSARESPMPEESGDEAFNQPLSEAVDNTLAASESVCMPFDINQQQTIDFRQLSIPANVDTSSLYGQTFFLLRLADDYNSYLPHYEGCNSMFELFASLNDLFKAMLTGELAGVALTQTEATRLQSIAQSSRVLAASKFEESSEEVSKVYEDVIELLT